MRKFRHAFGCWLLWRVLDILPRDEAKRLFDTINRGMAEPTERIESRVI